MQEIKNIVFYNADHPVQFAADHGWPEPGTVTLHVGRTWIWFVRWTGAYKECAFCRAERAFHGGVVFREGRDGLTSVPYHLRALADQILPPFEHSLDHRQGVSIP